jgi:O-antigen ligase
LKDEGQNGSRERLDTFCSRAIIALVLLVLAWSPLAWGGMDSVAFLVSEATILVALLLWIIRLWVQRPFRLFWPPVCWGVLLFIIYALVRCRLVVVEIGGRQELIQVLNYGAVFFLVLNNLNRRHSANFAALTLAGVGFAAAFLAIYQFVSHCPTIWGVKRMDQYLARGSGTFINPDHLAGFLEMTVPLALAYTVMSRFSATIKVLLAYGAVTMLAGIVVSLSRGGILATIIGLLLFCGLLIGQRDFRKPALAMLCAMVVLGLFALSQFESVQKRFNEAFKADKVDDVRSDYWHAAAELSKHSRIWGIGPGQFDVEFPSVRLWRTQGRPQFVHNDYLNTLCEWGMVGLALIGAVCVLLFWGVFQTWATVRKPANELGSGFSDRNAFTLGASVGLATLMLHCIVEFNMHIFAVAFTAVTLMALLAAQARFATERYWLNPGRIGKIILTIVILAGVAYLGGQGLRKGRQAYWLAKARSAQAQPDKVMAFAVNAHEAEPMDWLADYRTGEYLWSLSLMEAPDYIERARQALTWYSRAAELNPFDAYAPLACGMCLDRIGGAPEAATGYFLLAVHNDPHNTLVAMETGRHCIEMGEFAAAKKWILNGAAMWAGIDIVDAEMDKLYHLMSDPIYLAAAETVRTNRSKRLEQQLAPLLEGPK